MRSIASMSVLAALCISTAPGQEKQSIMPSVKYGGLKEEVLKHRGKVLVVDFWASY